MLDNSGTKFKVYTFYYKPFQNGKGFKWASKKLRKSISEALKNDSATVILKEYFDMTQYRLHD